VVANRTLASMSVEPTQRSRLWVIDIDL